MKIIKSLALFLAAQCLLSLVGCGLKSTEAETPDWGLTLTAEDVTPTALTIRFTQEGGSLSGELQTGTYFILEQKSGGKWNPLPYKDGLDADSIGWDAVAWLIPAGDSITFETDWEWLYGTLEAGTYRIGKEVMDFRGPGDYDTALVYAEFTIA